MSNQNNDQRRLRSWMRPITTTAIALISILLVISLSLNGLPRGSVHNPNHTTILALGLATLVTLYPLIRNFSLNEDPFEPSVILGGLLFLYFPLSAFGISILGFSPTFPSFQNNTDTLLPAFTWSLIVISAGAIVFYSGYRISRRSEIGPLWPTPAKRRLLVSNVFAVWAISILIHFIRKFGIVSSGNALLYHLLNLHYLAVLLLFASYYNSRGSLSSPRILVFVLSVEISLVTVLGFKLARLLILVIFISLAYHYLGPGFTYKKLTFLGSLVIVLFPISTLVENIQSSESFGHINGKGFVWYMKAVFRRMIGTDALTMIVARTPDPVSYQGGETLLLAIYGFVPRVIWSNKPSLIMCGVNNRYFSGRGVDANTCAAMTVPGELYWNFGAVGVVVGFLCVGVLLERSYRWFIRTGDRGNHYVILVVYAIVLLALMRFGLGFGQLVNNIVKQLAFAVVFLWFVTAPVGSSTVNLNGNSVLERSHFHRFGKGVYNMLTYFLTSSLVGRMFRLVLTFPQRVSDYAKIDSPVQHDGNAVLERSRLYRTGKEAYNGATHYLLFSFAGRIIRLIPAVPKLLLTHTKTSRVYALVIQIKNRLRNIWVALSGNKNKLSATINRIRTIYRHSKIHQIISNWL